VKRDVRLGEFIDWYRQELADETVGMRRSWEEVFKYTLRRCSKDVPMKDFDLEILSERLSSSGMHEAMVAGYIKRWRAVLDKTVIPDRGRDE